MPGAMGMIVLSCNAIWDTLQGTNMPPSSPRCNHTALEGLCLCMMQP